MDYAPSRRLIQEDGGPSKGFSGCFRILGREGIFKAPDGGFNGRTGGYISQFPSFSLPSTFLGRFNVSQQIHLPERNILTFSIVARPGGKIKELRFPDGIIVEIMPGIFPFAREYTCSVKRKGKVKCPCSDCISPFACGYFSKG